MRKLILVFILIFCVNNLFSGEGLSLNFADESAKFSPFQLNPGKEISLFNTFTNRMSETIDDYLSEWEIGGYGGRRYFSVMLNPFIITQSGAPDGFGYNFLGINYDIYPFFSIGANFGISIFGREEFEHLSWGGLSLSAGPILPLFYNPDELKIILFADFVLQIGYSELSIFNVGFDLGIVFTIMELIGIEIKYQGIFHPENNFMNHIGIALVWDLGELFEELFDAFW